MPCTPLQWSWAACCRRSPQRGLFLPPSRFRRAPLAIRSSQTRTEHTWCLLEAQRHDAVSRVQGGSAHWSVWSRFSVSGMPCFHCDHHSAGCVATGSTTKGNTPFVSDSRCMCMQVQVHVVHKKDFKGYTCTCMHVSCASTVCVIRLAGCVCNFIIKAHAVFFCFSLLFARLSLISLSSLSLFIELPT